MNAEKISSLSIKGDQIIHVGSLSNKVILLFIGRSNAQKKSPAIQALLDKLKNDDCTIIWHKPFNDAAVELLTAKSKIYLAWLDKLLGPHDFIVKTVFEKIIKAIILAAHPKRWGYFFTFPKNNDIQFEAGRLRRVLDLLGKDKTIYIMAHSAGGRIASLLGNEPAVKKIICFGYPFKHPQKTEEPERTEHLRHVKKPFLIIQGCNDEYGGSDVINRYNLSKQISFEFIDCNHDYDYENISEAAWLKIAVKIKAFLAI